MKFQPIFDLWNIPEGLRKYIQPGQMIYAGERADTGRFCGVKPSGSIVVAWSNNAKRHKGGRRDYFRTLRQYAKGK